MRGEILFEKMTGISEEYITEAALVPAAGMESTKRSRFASLALSLNNGWGVACICLLLAVAAVVSLLHWGLPKEPVNPFPPTVDPNAPRYVFTMDSLHSFSYGESVDRPAERGEYILLSISVQNNGPAFQIRDSEWAQLSAVCVLQGDDSVTLEWRYSPRDGGNFPYWVSAGATENLGFVLTIPEDATPGVYDLVLSYDGVQQVISGALTVGDPTGETKPPMETTFSLGYEPFDGFALVNSYIHITTWIVNEGAPFTFTGSSMGFLPSAVLVHMETGYSIEGSFDVTTDLREVTVKTGDEGRCTQEFFIPADAPTGSYRLVLSFAGVSQAFEHAVTVSIDTPSLDPEDMWDIAEQYIPQIAENVDRIYYTRGGYSHSADGTQFSFRVTILGMQTTESLYVTLGNRGEYRSHEQDPQTYSLFIPYVTAEMVEAAKPPLYEHPDYPLKLKHQYGLTLRDGDLYLTYACYEDCNEDGHIDCECEKGYLYTARVFLCADPQRVESPAPLTKLTMAVGEEWLYEPLEEAYVSGEEVTLRFKSATDIEPLFILNGAFVESTSGGEQLGYWEYSFTMPEKDSAIYFHTYDKTLPYANMLESCIAWDHYNFSEKEFYYYGEFGNGVMVALLLGNGEQVTGTSVGMYQFITPTTHEMLAYYNGGLYWLEIAYEDYELLTEEDLSDLFAVHKSFFPNCYDDLPSPKKTRRDTPSLRVFRMSVIPSTPPDEFCHILLTTRPVRGNNITQYGGNCMEKQNFPLFAVPSETCGLRDLPPAEPGARSRTETDHEGGCGCNQSPACVGYEGCGPDSMGLCEHPLAMVYAPCQYYRALYDPATALSRGTLFTELDLPLGSDEGSFTTLGCGCRYDRRDTRDIADMGERRRT